MHSPAPEIYAIDLDETVYRTDLAFAKMVDLAVRQGLVGAPRLITEARGAVEQSGGSFDLISYLAIQGVPAMELDGLQTEFGRNAEGDELLYPDAHPLYEALSVTGTPFFTYTKGGTRTQLSKLQSCGLIGQPYRITDSMYKGGEIAQDMRRGVGRYVVHALQGDPGRPVLFEATSLYLLEDKPAAFQGLPDDASGALVRRHRPRGMLQQGSVPSRVRTVHSLAPITERIYRRANSGAA